MGWMTEDEIDQTLVLLNKMLDDDRIQANDVRDASDMIELVEWMKTIPKIVLKK